MNENLQNALVELIEKSTAGVGAAIDVLAAETPEVISQLLVWYSIYSALMMAIGLALLISPFVLIIKYERWCQSEFEKEASWTKLYSGSKSSSFGYNMRRWVSGIPSAGIFIIGLCMVNLEWLQIIIAPKVWLIEYAAKLSS